MELDLSFCLLIINDGKLECHSGNALEIVRILVEQDPEPHEFKTVFGKPLPATELWNTFRDAAGVKDHVDLITSFEQIMNKDNEPASAAQDNERSQS